MIKLSKKGGYALKAMIYISKQNDIVKINDISKDLSISVTLLRRIISDIEKTGIIKTIKGRNGGVLLGKDLKDINMYDILKSVGEDLHITECTSGGNCNREDICETSSIFKGLQKGFNSLLKIYTFDKIIKKNGKISFDNIINKARNLEYTGDLGGAIKLYEEHYSIKENRESIVYNHNMAKLYETAGKNDLAISKYKFLIEKFKNYTYLRDISILYENMGNKDKAKKFLDAYNKYTKKNSNSGISLDVETK